MKSKLLLICIIAVLALPVMAAPPTMPAKVKSPKSAQILDTDAWINANKILMFVTNDGVIGTDLGLTLGKTDGLYFPYTSVEDIISGANNTSVIYSSGIWIGAIDDANDDTLIAIAEYGEEYGPGPMIGGTFDPGQLDKGEYRVYKIYRDSTPTSENGPNTDWLEWPFDQGAPADSIDSIITTEAEDTTIVDTFYGEPRPALVGDQTLWTVFNDANPALHTVNQGSTDPLGIEVQLTSFAFDREDPFGNIVFVRYKLLNKGGKDLKQVYVSLWADPDLGGAADDLVGSDTVLSMGFTYNATNNDNQYGSRPPAVGYDFFQGPLFETGLPEDTAQMWGQLYPGFINLPMASFNKYINGTDPSSYFQSYAFMAGLDKVSGNMVPYVNPVTGQVTTYQKSGDPVAGTGDLDDNPADRRMMLTTGPFDFPPGDSTEVVAAIIVGQGADRKSSIAAMKYFDRFAQDAYDRFFQLGDPPARPDVSVSNNFNSVTLTWTDRSERDPGEYPFEGYTVSQALSPAGPWVRIANYDVSNDITVIFEEQFDIANGVLVQAPTKFGTDQGIQRYITIDQDFINGGELNNYTEYYYRVDAYSYTSDTTLTQRTLTSSAVVTATPQPPVAGTEAEVAYRDTIPAVHAVGVAGAQVLPLVLDQSRLTGNEYQVTFDFAPDTTIEFHQDTSIFSHPDTITYICGVVGPDTTYCDTIIDVVDSIVLDPPIAEVDTVVTPTPFWRLTNLTTGEIVLDSQFNITGDENYAVVDGMLLKVSGPPQPGVKPGFEGDPDQGWSIPAGTRRFTWAGGADGLGFEGFEHALGWAAPSSVFGGLPNPVPAEDLVNVRLELAPVTVDGDFDPNHADVSYGYRFMRGAANPPALPEFAPFIINAVGGYSFQEFAKNVPLAAYNIDVDPPQRLVVGYLENNVAGGLVDGKYWPPYNAAADNTDAAGPREWLFIYNAPYSETFDPALALELTGNQIPIMYFATWARRAEVAWEDVDAFEIYPFKVITQADTFNFTATSTAVAAGETKLENIRVVPNPYYLFSNYDPNTYNRQLRFTALPEICTISIYNIAGDLVDRIEKNSPDSWTTWDVETSAGIPVASGIYIWVVEAPGFGQRIGKMAVFMESEQLNTY